MVSIICYICQIHFSCCNLVDKYSKSPATSNKVNVTRSFDVLAGESPKCENTELNLLCDLLEFISEEFVY